MATHTGTPAEVSKHVLRLVSKVAPGQTPAYLNVNPEPSAIVGECFANVDARVKASGGELVYGWLLWEWPHVLCEAEFHAVWRDSDGVLHEITPKQDGDKRVLFVPDPTRRYAGIPIDNVRMAVRDDMLVHHFIAVAEEIVRVRVSSGKDAGPGRVSMPTHRIMPLIEVHTLIGSMLQNGQRANDSCACGSGFKYKRCHGRAIENAL